MTELLVKNSKIANSNDNNNTVYNFGIPAHRAQSGLKTCPMAGQCAIGCYAKQGPYAWDNVKAAYEARLAITLQADFVALMIEAIATKFKTAIKKNKQLIIRIHDSGDFYNIEYVNKWLSIINAYPSVKFYAYTKMIPIFKRLKANNMIPSNLVIIYSEGGLADHLIQDTDRHAKVFESLEDLLAAGYTDTTENDLNAIGPNHKVGLVYHGAKSKKWTTAA